MSARRSWEGCSMFPPWQQERKHSVCKTETQSSPRYELCTPVSDAAWHRSNTSTPMKRGEKLKAALGRPPCCQHTHCVKIQQSNHGWSSKNKSEVTDNLKWLFMFPHMEVTREMRLNHNSATNDLLEIRLFCFSCIWNAYSKESYCVLVFFHLHINIL